MPKYAVGSFSPEQLLSTFFNNSNVGLAVFDRQMRYNLVNQHLASTHGISPESHRGKSLRDILGPVAEQIEPSIERVFVTARPIINQEIAGPVPSRGFRRWVDNFFPITSPDGRVDLVGVVVVELPPDGPAPTEGAQASRDQKLLRSWKDIACYVGACVKTVQRWEQDFRFPVRRLNPSKGAVVYAVRSEIDEWLLARHQD